MSMKQKQEMMEKIMATPDAELSPEQREMKT
jgi:hypothetical protein